MPQKRFVRLLKWILKEIDAIIALLIAALCAVLGVFGATQSLLTTATLGILAVLAFMLLRDRSQREDIQYRLDQLTTPLDGLGLDDVYKISVDDTPITEEADNEVLLVQETGKYFLDNKSASIEDLLKKGVTVKFAVINAEKETLRYLTLRNENSASDISSFDLAKNRLLAVQQYMQSFANNLGPYAEKLQVRFTSYILDSAFIFVDAESSVQRKRKAIILHLGFRVPFRYRLGVLIKGELSPKIFSYYYKQACDIFDYSSKIILLTGASGSGKTSIFMKLMDSMNAEELSRVSFVLSRPTYDKKNRMIGYEIITSLNSTPRIYVTFQNNGSYDINDQVWTSAVEELEQAFLEGKILVIDEIGTAQIANVRFLSLLEKVFNSPSATLFATFSSDNQSKEIDRYKFNYRSTVLRLQSDAKGRNEVEKVLLHEMRTSLILNYYLNTNL